MEHRAYQGLSRIGFLRVFLFHRMKRSRWIESYNRMGAVPITPNRMGTHAIG